MTLHNTAWHCSILHNHCPNTTCYTLELLGFLSSSSRAVQRLPSPTQWPLCPWEWIPWKESHVWFHQCMISFTSDNTWSYNVVSLPSHTWVQSSEHVSHSGRGPSPTGRCWPSRSRGSWGGKSPSGQGSPPGREIPSPRDGGSLPPGRLKEDIYTDLFCCNVMHWCWYKHQFCNSISVLSPTLPLAFCFPTYTYLPLAYLNYFPMMTITQITVASTES